MIRTILFASLLSLFFSCQLDKKKKDKDMGTDRLNMLEADRSFSDLSEEKGMKTAFIEYIDSNGVLLRPNQVPIVGADAIDYLIQLNDSNYVLTWRPKSGEVAKSGELGYTYGIYTLKPSEKDTLLYGTYVSIWKKQADGHWKFVLDTGNEGIGEEELEQ
jgi:ketosteroid isomerase-like protein